MKNRLIWIDLEMTGLDVETHVIIEIAAVVTDEQLHIIAEAPVIAVAQPEQSLSRMDKWSREHHQASGLLDRVKNSSTGCRQAELEIIAFTSTHCEKNQSPLCGNSVWQDRLFLRKYMPELEAFFHYRNIDVSSIKELVKKWYPCFPPFQKQKTHLALQDIRESIQELNYYRLNLFRSQEEIVQKIGVLPKTRD